MSDMRFKIGDEVTVKNVRINEGTGEVFFADQMKQYIGRTGVIEDIYRTCDDQEIYQIEGFGRWHWSSWWLEPADKEAEENRRKESEQISDFIDGF